MSQVLYLAADYPLPKRPNPHEQLLSVNEAIAAGVSDIPDFLLKDGIDRDEPDAILVSDREVRFDVENGTVADGDFDDDFAILPVEKLFGMRTEKKYCALLEWNRYTPGRAGMLIKYLRERLTETDEIELWNCWLDDEPIHQMRRAVVRIGELTPEDIAELDSQSVSKLPLTDYCFCVIRG